MKRDYPTRKAKLDHLFAIDNARTRVTFGPFQAQEALIVRSPTWDECAQFLLRDGRRVDGPYSDRKPEIRLYALKAGGV